MLEAVFHPENVFSIHGRGTVVTGRLESGVLGMGMTTKIGNTETQVAGIETFRKTLETVTAGDPNSQSIGVLLKGIKKEEVSSYIKSEQTIVFKGPPPPTPITSSTSPASTIVGESPKEESQYSLIVTLFILLLAITLFFIFNA